MGRYREASGYFDRAYRIMQRHARQNPNDVTSQLMVAAWGAKLARVLRHGDAQRALQIYDEALAFLGAVANNRDARRNEARVLAESTYPLRQLGRSAEARQRLDAAFTRLNEFKLYPAQRVEAGSEPLDALCALAEVEAGAGKVQRGIEIYQHLIAKLTPAIQPEARLGDATELSTIYRALAQLHRRARKDDAASALEAQRRDLWRHWDRKLPNNPRPRPACPNQVSWSGQLVRGQGSLTTPKIPAVVFYPAFAIT